MSRLAHDQKSPARRASPGVAGATVPLLLGLAGASLGCNIVQGYQDAGDSLFPEQSTHLAAPGVQLVRGSYRELGLVAGSELYLVARAPDDPTSTLFSMRYASPRPCELKGVVRLDVTRERTRSAPLFSYFSEDVRRGTLRFADARCNTYDLTFEDAALPIGETPKSVVVWAGSDLWLATPETGERERLATDVEQVTRNVFGQRVAVRAGGRLLIFGADWRLKGTFGEQVSAVLRTDNHLFYLDAVGAHRISATDADPPRLTSTLLAKDACSLGSRDGEWVTLRAPCTPGEDGMPGPVLAIDARTEEAFRLPFDAEPTQVMLMPARGSRGRDPTTEPYWFFYLRSGPSDDTQNTLYVRTPDGREHALGARATLDQLRLIEPEEDGEEAYGYALIDVEGEAGRYIWWDASGETRVLAERTLWRPNRLFIDADGPVGSLAITSGQRLQVLAERVPWEAFEYSDSTKDWTVLFHDLQPDGKGRLSVIPRTLDDLQSSAPDEPFSLPPLAPVTADAIVAGTAALDEVLSGVSYLRDYDLDKRTGTLAYRNLELRFTATIKAGVSDYLITSDEILYAVPYGKDAGIWLVAAK